MRALYILTALLLIIAAGCKKSNDANPIAATWQIKYNYNNDHDAIRQLSFDDKGSFNMKVVVVNKSRQFLGYISKGNGKYSMTGDQMTFNYQQQYYKADNQQEYVAEDKLTLSTGTPQTSVSQFSFNAKKDTLTLITNSCPPNALCFVGPIIEKYNKVSLNATY